MLPPTNFAKQTIILPISFDFCFLRHFVQRWERPELDSWECFLFSERFSQLNCESFSWRTIMGWTTHHTRQAASIRFCLCSHRTLANNLTDLKTVQNTLHPRPLHYQIIILFYYGIKRLMWRSWGNIFPYKHLSISAIANPPLLCGLATYWHCAVQ